MKTEIKTKSHQETINYRRLFKRWSVAEQRRVKYLREYRCKVDELHDLELKMNIFKREYAMLGCNERDTNIGKSIRLYYEKLRHQHDELHCVIAKYKRQWHEAHIIANHYWVAHRTCRPVISRLFTNPDRTDIDNFINNYPVHLTIARCGNATIYNVMITDQEGEMVDSWNV